MGALNPLFLLAAAALAVPLLLHLFHRQRARRIAFPALRYLERTEREHARRIRARQILLLLLRVGVVVAVVAAGARLYLRGRGAAHPPTALVVVLDNSASSGRVVGERRVLDVLEELAEASLAGAGPEDRVWVMRAGEPWSPAVPMTPAAASARVRETTVSAAAADLGEALRRAGELLRTAPLAHREIHLLSDLQTSAFPEAPRGLEEIPVVAWADPGDVPPNRALLRVLVGGGLPPLVGQRTEVTVWAASESPEDTVPIPVRVVVDGRIRGAASVPPGTAVSIPLPPSPSGWVRGWVETDPDALRADDRRHFAFRSRAAPTLATAGEIGPFVAEAIAVLEGAGRLREAFGQPPELLVAGDGEGLRSPVAGGSALVLPPADPARLPALNRRLADAGVPWRYDRVERRGEVELRSVELPEALEGVVVRRWYALEMTADPVAAPRVLARAAGDPWAVEGSDGTGRRHLLLASPLDEASSSLPVSTAMVRFLAWAAGTWAAGGGGDEATGHPAGTPLSAPRGASSVRLPSGDTLAIGGTRRIEATAEAGLYEFLEADSVVRVVAVDPPASESALAPLAPERLEALLDAPLTTVRRAEDWPDAVYRARQGPELWRLALLAAVAILLVESWVAAAGRSRREAAPPSRAAPGA